MLGVIIDCWDEARAKQLRKEFDDCMARLERADDIFKTSALMHCHKALGDLESYRLLDEYSRKEKKQAAKRLLKAAQQSYANDVARGHGLFLLSAYIESMALPGPDAVYVHAATQAIVDGAE